MKEILPIYSIAPCGINCSLCFAYQRDKNKCTGCNSAGTQKPKHCFICSIKTCEHQKGYCYDCTKFPCRRVKQLDKRYKAKYHTSIIENLLLIKSSGIESLIESDIQKWTCSNCGGLLCMHREHCLKCTN